MPRDPICGMEVSLKEAVRLERDGEIFYFCSPHCRDRFLAEGEAKIIHRGHAPAKYPEGLHLEHHAHMVADFKRRLSISLIATLPVLILSPLIQSFFNFSLSFPGDRFLLFGISSFIYFYGGRPFLKGVFDEIGKKQPGMMTLVALAITAAYLYSSLVVFGIRGEFFFWELVTLIDIMLLGHWIEMRSVMAASRALESLARLLPSAAHLVLADGSIKEILLEELKQKDTVLVRPGEKIPADGRIIDGESEINQAMITGESRPVSKKEGDEVIGGSVNGSGSLIVEVRKTGKDSYLSQVVELVRKASESKSRVQNLANRVAFWLTLIAVTVGTATLLVWLMLGKEFVFALERMITVMVITCPHALGLAIPLVIAVITAISAQNGLLIRNRTAFENACNVDTIVFDKTGTLTKGEFGVSNVISLGDWSEEDLLRKVASIEENSEHTIAKGIVRKAEEKNLKLSKAERFQAIPGKGAKAEVEGEEIFIGNRGIFDVANLSSIELEKRIEEIALEGKTVVFVLSGGQLQGIIGLSDIIREESKEAIRNLKELGIEMAMITGDNRPTAKYVALQLQLDTYFAEVFPEKKSEKITELQNLGKKVAMVGDGVNDAPALAQADIGVAIGAGTDVAIETADIILVRNDPRNVLDVIALSRLTRRKMVQNLAWATAYNILAIPLASGLFYRYGIVLVPAIGALIMSLSTIIVAVNARLIHYVNRWQS